MVTGLKITCVMPMSCPGSGTQKCTLCRMHHALSISQGGQHLRGRQVQRNNLRAGGEVLQSPIHFQCFCLVENRCVDLRSRVLGGSLRRCPAPLSARSLVCGVLGAALLSCLLWRSPRLIVLLLLCRLSLGASLGTRLLEGWRCTLGLLLWLLREVRLVLSHRFLVLHGLCFVLLLVG